MPWTPTAEVRARAGAQHVAYEGPPQWEGRTSCAGDLSPGSKALCRSLRAVDHNVSRCEGYECLPSSLQSGVASMHATGRALDVFIRGAPGDALAGWLVSHAEAIGVQYVIWDRTQWSSAHGFTAYGGPSPHDDHIHLELTHAAAAMQTRFFHEGIPAEGSSTGLWAAGTALVLGYVFREDLAALWRSR